MKKITTLLILSLFFTCRLPVKPSQLYDNYKGSVALVKHSYYFTTVIGDKLPYYFTIHNGEYLIHKTEQEAINNAATNYGTGFFISRNGEIVTNKHIISPNEKEENAIQSIKEKMAEVPEELKSRIAKREDKLAEITALYREYKDILSYSEVQELSDSYDEVEYEISEIEKVLADVKFDPNSVDIKIKTISLGVALDDTHVTNEDDFKDCVIIKEPNDESLDLVLLQLKDKRTPEYIKQVFSLDKADETELNLNDKVYMIGFNQGMFLANTEEGIKSQFTQGVVTQDPDSKQVMYSVPTLAGSSGSPIINEWGDLVAINYAKVNDYQGFSFGIPVRKLWHFYNDKSIASPVSNKNGSEDVTVTTSTNQQLDYFTFSLNEKIDFILSEKLDAGWRLEKMTDNSWHSSNITHIKYIREKDNDFPFIVQGDFDDDGVTDIALKVVKRNDFRLVIFSPQKNEITWWEHEVKNAVIKAAPRAELSNFDGTKMANMQGKAIMVEYLESNVYYIYWDGEKYDRIWMYD